MMTKYLSKLLASTGFIVIVGSLLFFNLTSSAIAQDSDAEHQLKELEQRLIAVHEAKRSSDKARELKGSGRKTGESLEDVLSDLKKFETEHRGTSLGFLAATAILTNVRYSRSVPEHQLLRNELFEVVLSKYLENENMDVLLQGCYYTTGWDQAFLDATQKIIKSNSYRHVKAKAIFLRLHMLVGLIQTRDWLDQEDWQIWSKFTNSYVDARKDVSKSTDPIAVRLRSMKIAEDAKRLDMLRVRPMVQALNQKLQNQYADLEEEGYRFTKMHGIFFERTNRRDIGRDYVEKAKLMMMLVNDLIPGKPAPKIVGTTLDGKESFDLENLRGNIVLISFDSIPPRDEEHLIETFKDKPVKFVCALPTDPAKHQRFQVRKREMLSRLAQDSKYQCITDSSVFGKALRGLTGMFDTRALLIDGQGIIRYRVHPNAQVKDKIQKLLASQGK